MARLIVLDASVLIAYLDEDDALHEAAAGLLEREIQDDFAVGTVTLAEVLVAPARSGRLDDVLDALAALEIKELALSDRAAVRLARLRASTRLKMPDCCVLLTAMEADARLASFDNRVATAARRAGIRALDA